MADRKMFVVIFVNEEGDYVPVAACETLALAVGVVENFKDSNWNNLYWCTFNPSEGRVFTHNIMAVPFYSEGQP